MTDPGLDVILMRVAMAVALKLPQLASLCGPENEEEVDMLRSALTPIVEAACHTVTCEVCGQPVDRRDLTQVMVHLHAGPVPVLDIGAGTRVDGMHGVREIQRLQLVVTARDKQIEAIQAAALASVTAVRQRCSDLAREEGQTNLAVKLDSINLASAMRGPVGVEVRLVKS